MKIRFKLDIAQQSIMQPEKERKRNERGRRGGEGREGEIKTHIFIINNRYVHIHMHTQI